MRIVLTNNGVVPIYEQIKTQVREAIIAGTLAPGEALPSIRSLARDLRISVITTTRAYNDLEQEGYLTLIQGKGAYVRQVDAALVRERLLCDIEEALAAVCANAALARLSAGEVHLMLDQALQGAQTPIMSDLTSE